ncbi:O-methyltransferase [Sphingomonas sp. UYEF23]|uniref:O-methyltransferase n=1 Tax=Sphingomonas sp. UYEF23 TaxID=1756408 RepID=UPI0033998FEC
MVPPHGYQTRRVTRQSDLWVIERQTGRLPLVGIFHTESDTSKVDDCGFDKIDFITDPLRPVRIEVPLLTPKEIRAVEAQLPLRLGDTIDPGSSPLAHAQRLAKLYRYLPSYMVAEIYRCADPPRAERINRSTR